VKVSGGEWRAFVNAAQNMKMTLGRAECGNSKRPWRPRGVYCEVRTSPAYKKVKLSLSQAVEAQRCFL
jgi:hypothetical protein